MTRSRLAPEQVLAAGKDFSPRRAEVFPAVSTKHLDVHQLDEVSADTTEGTPAGVGVDWGALPLRLVKAGLGHGHRVDSNVYEPGADSSWHLRAMPAEGGSTAEMIWVREFQPGARGRIFATVFRVVGMPVLTRDAKRILRNLERLESNGA